MRPAAGGSGTKPSNGTGANSKPDMKPPQRPAPSSAASGKQKPRSKKGEFSFFFFFFFFFKITDHVFLRLM